MEARMHPNPDKEHKGGGEPTITLGRWVPNAEEKKAFNEQLPEYLKSLATEIEKWAPQFGAALRGIKYLVRADDAEIKMAVMIAAHDDAGERIHDSFCHLELGLLRKFQAINVHWTTIAPEEDSLQMRAFFNGIESIQVYPANKAA